MKKPLIVSAAGLLSIVIFWSTMLSAHAAPLNFTSAETVNIISPSTTLTIATGSAADSLTINATSVLVTISQTTGGSFMLLSAFYDLSVATSTPGGTATVACNNGIENVTLSQNTGSTIYTITPTTNNCANASAPNITAINASNITTNSATITWTTNVPADSTISYGTTTSYGATSTDATLVTNHDLALSGLAPSTLYHFIVTSSENSTSTTSNDNTFTTNADTSGGSSEGGGNGVSSAYGLPFNTSTGVSASGTLSTTTSSLEAELEVLLTELAALQNQTAKQNTLPFIFTRNLSYGTTGRDVKQLQQFLIAQNSGPAARAIARHGITKNFATLTKNALIEFQKTMGINPASGYFGPTTRSYVNNLTQ